MTVEPGSEGWLESGVRRPPGSPLRVVLHVGAFKTGTSYVQNVLWAGRDVLAAQGVLFPGKRSWGDQVHAVRDALGVRATKPRQEGAWERLTAQLDRWAGSHAVISMEFLSLAQPAKARRIVSDLAGAEVVVVLTARDLVRVVPAAWQERVKNGRDWTWRQFVDSVRNAPDTQPGKGFWSQQDLGAIARRWSGAVGHDGVTVVTVPPSGSEPAELLRRFGVAGGADLSAADPSPAWDNASLGAVETEALRRVNTAMRDQAREPAWSRLVKRDLARTGIDVASRPLRLTADDMAWVRPRQHQLVDELRTGGWRVVGDLADLEPASPRLATQPLDDVDERDVAEALAQVAAEMGRHVLAAREALAVELRNGLASQTSGEAPPVSPDR